MFLNRHSTVWHRNTPISHGTVLRHKEVKWLVLFHTASKWWAEIWIMVFLTSEIILHLTILFLVLFFFFFLFCMLWVIDEPGYSVTLALCNTILEISFFLNFLRSPKVIALWEIHNLCWIFKTFLYYLKSFLLLQSEKVIWCLSELRFDHKSDNIYL